MEYGAESRVWMSEEEVLVRGDRGATPVVGTGAVLEADIMDRPACGNCG